MNTPLVFLNAFNKREHLELSPCFWNFSDFRWVYFKVCFLIPVRFSYLFLHPFFLPVSLKFMILLFKVLLELGCCKCRVFSKLALSCSDYHAVYYPPHFASMVGLCFVPDQYNSHVTDKGNMHIYLNDFWSLKKENLILT